MTTVWVVEVGPELHVCGLDYHIHGKNIPSCSCLQVPRGKVPDLRRTPQTPCNRLDFVDCDLITIFDIPFNPPIDFV